MEFIFTLIGIWKFSVKNPTLLNFGVYLAEDIYEGLQRSFNFQRKLRPVVCRRASHLTINTNRD